MGVHAARDNNGPERSVWAALAAIADPELPILSIVDLGIVRHVKTRPDGTIEVGLTPTYSACPATEVIHQLVQQALAEHGIKGEVRTVLSPAWTSDWLSDSGREKLRKFGIAPPPKAVTSVKSLMATRSACPHCGSENTELLSEFGSTPCKALHRCRSCLEPFDQFKCI